MSGWTLKPVCARPPRSLLFCLYSPRFSRLPAGVLQDVPASLLSSLLCGSIPGCSVSPQVLWESEAPWGVSSAKLPSPRGSRNSLAATCLRPAVIQGPGSADQLGEAPVSPH